LGKNTGSFASKHWEFYIKTPGVLGKNTQCFFKDGKDAVFRASTVGLTLTGLSTLSGRCNVPTCQAAKLPTG
jgi:hypothetical protein